MWYRYPIPNDIREFWYYQRPDILNYLQTAYKELDIEFLPNNIIQEVIQNDTLQNTNMSLSNENFLQSNLIVDFINNYFYNVF